MRICKYCKKPILDNNVWNPDREGNGYHHACLCEIEFKLRDKRIYDKGRADMLDKIRAEIKQEYNRLSATRADETLELGECLGLKMSLKIIDKYKESEEENG